MYLGLPALPGSRHERIVQAIAGIALAITAYAFFQDVAVFPGGSERLARIGTRRPAAASKSESVRNLDTYILIRGARQLLTLHGPPGIRRRSKHERSRVD